MTIECAFPSINLYKCVYAQTEYLNLFLKREVVFKGGDVSIFAQISKRHILFKISCILSQAGDFIYSIFKSVMVELLQILGLTHEANYIAQCFRLLAFKFYYRCGFFEFGGSSLLNSLLCPSTIFN